MDGGTAALRLAMPRTPDSNTYTRIDGLRAGGEYRFAVQAVELGSAGALSELGAVVTTARVPDVLLVAGRRPLSENEQELQRHLQGMGLMVHVTLDHELVPHGSASERHFRPWSASAGSSATARLMVALPSCSAAVMRSWWATSTAGRTASVAVSPTAAVTATAGSARGAAHVTAHLPCLVLDSTNWASLGLAVEADSMHDAWAELVVGRHPLAAGLGGGRVALYRRASAIQIARPLPSALVVADVGGSNSLDRSQRSEWQRGSRGNSAVLFGYERGVLGAHRAVGFGIGSAGVGALSADGLALLTAAPSPGPPSTSRWRTAR
eukprot:4853545-Prymnesium_polylepis.1